MWIHGKGLTFIECVIAVVIVVLFLVVVLPVFSRDEINFREEKLNTNLSQLREQVKAYRHDHGGNYPSGERFEAQLTLRTNIRGDVCPHGASPQKYPFGPYIKQIPVNPYAATRVGNRVKAGLGRGEDGNAGWIYNPQTGQITPDRAEISN